jgi:hypothetical protein
MIEAGEPSTEVSEHAARHCVRPTGGSHARTTDAPEQRYNDVNLRGSLEVG